MKKKIIKKKITKKLYKMDLLENLRMSLLNSNFVMIHIIYKILVMIKNYLNNLKDNIFECFFKKYNRLLIITFFHNIK